VTVEIRLPRILDPVVGGTEPTRVASGDVATVLDGLLTVRPELRVHLFDEAFRLRPHVLCFVDGVSDRLEDRSRPVADGSTVEFLHAVSGG
jgi:hypothetical protein